MKVNGPSGTQSEAGLANSIFKAVYNCLPLRLTPAFGGSIAGRVIVIRFVAPLPPAPSVNV